MRSPLFCPDEKFDIVQSIEVLHLILDDHDNHSEAIRNMVSALVSNGVLITTDTLPKSNDQVNDYIVFRPADYYDKLFNQLGMTSARCLPNVLLAS